MPSWGLSLGEGRSVLIYSERKTIELEECGLQGLIACIQAIHCLNFHICEMGTWLGRVGITGHLGRGCKSLSGQPEILSGHLPPGVLRRHIGEARATPSSFLVLAEEERADS